MQSFIVYSCAIVLADDGCNTATESSQTNRLLRVFHSCYFHYSKYILLYIYIIYIYIIIIYISIIYIIYYYSLRKISDFL